MDIREALGTLNTLDDEVWTSEGAPKIEAVKELLGRSVTRQEIIEAAPKFTRQNPDLGDEPKVEEVEKEAESSDSREPVDLSDALSVEPMDVNSFLKFLDRVPTSQLQDLKDGLDTRRKELQDLRYKIDDFDRALSGSLTLVKSRIQREIPDISDREANMAYLKSQLEQRARKKAFTNEVLKGIKLSDLDPRAPIDRAFARKTARGTQRPGT
jgi:hypothetical protein